MLTKRECCCGPKPGCAACVGSPIPDLHVTDSNASFIATWTGAVLPIEWRGSYTLSKTGLTSITVLGGIFPDGATYTTGSITMTVSYLIRCNDASDIVDPDTGEIIGHTPANIVVGRSWHLFGTDSTIENQCTCENFVDKQIYADDSLGLVDGCGPTTALPDNCSIGLSGAVATTESFGCNPFSCSATPVGSPGNLDPAPGGVAITA